jgi:hypothetical protein
MGLAIAGQIEGPYVQLPFPVTSNNRAIISSERQALPAMY